MIDLGAVIDHFGQKAVSIQINEGEIDTRAIAAVHNASSKDRVAIVWDWLRYYRVFQGIPDPSRHAIAEAVLRWADSQGQGRDLSTTIKLDQAHAELMAACAIAYGKDRRFTSLASKAMWLCYPDTVPMYDKFACNALYVISKMDADISPLTGSESEYCKFVHVWKSIYDRYSSALSSIDVGNYPYRVRLFDRILWIIGSPDYKYSG